MVLTVNNCFISLAEENVLTEVFQVNANILLYFVCDRALYNIGKRSFVPPTLKEKDKWQVFLYNNIIEVSRTLQKARLQITTSTLNPHNITVHWGVQNIN